MSGGLGSQPYDIAVIGAGIGGLTAACLLAQSGRSVIVLERAARAGGVCQRLLVDGHEVEMGPTLLSAPAPGEPLSVLCQRLGVRLAVQAADPMIQVAMPDHRISLYADAEAWHREVRRECPQDERGWHALWARVEALSVEGRRTIQELLPLPPERWIERLRHWGVLRLGLLSPIPAKTRRMLLRAMATPFEATIAQHGLGDISRRVLEAALWYLSLRGPEECSTLEAALVLGKFRRGAVVLPEGIVGLLDGLTGEFERAGGQLRLGTAVARVVSAGRGIRELVTDGGETIRARWVIADVPPSVLAGPLFPSNDGWFGRRHALVGDWHPSRVAQGLVVGVPAAVLPSELSGHCFVIQDPRRPARDDNLVFIRATPTAHPEPQSQGLRYLTVTRFTVARPQGDGASAVPELLEVLDQIVPGVADAMVFHRLLTPSELGEAWGRPSAAVRYTADVPQWLGQRGAPHGLGRTGLMAVGEWTYPGRLLSDVVEGAMRVVDLIGRDAGISP